MQNAQFANDYPAIKEFEKSIDWSDVQPWNRYEIYYSAFQFYMTRKDNRMTDWAYNQLCKSRREPLDQYIDDVIYIDGGDTCKN
jgi:hypothetical protein